VTKRTRLPEPSPSSIRRPVLWQPRSPDLARRLFGEMTCMEFLSLPPSRGTLRHRDAESDVVAFEMLRNVLDIMLKNKSFRRAARPDLWRRASKIIFAASRCSRIFVPDFNRAPERKVELQRFAPARRSRPGEPARSFLSRSHGVVKSLKNYPGGELVICLSLQRRLFGEIGLVGRRLRTPPDRTRPVEVVVSLARLPPSD